MQSAWFLSADDTPISLSSLRGRRREVLCHDILLIKVLPRVLVHRLSSNQTSSPRATHTKFQVDKTSDQKKSEAGQIRQSNHPGVPRSESLFSYHEMDNRRTV